MYLNRMLLLREAVAKAPAERFSMCIFHSVLPGSTCGTSACALGWAGLYPKLRKLGLRTLRTNNVRYGKSEGLAAGAKFFGINISASITLFANNKQNSAGDGETQRYHFLRRLDAMIEKERALRAMKRVA